MSTPADELLSRVDAVEARLHSLAERPAPQALTDPDASTGEQWEWGQVWAHLAEFPSYWMEEIRMIVDTSRPDPVPFGRTKSDPRRLEAIERDRRIEPAKQMRRVETQLRKLRELLQSLEDAAWRRTGRHPTLGEMPMEHIFDEFLVGHLEEHADQLEAVATQR